MEEKIYPNLEGLKISMESNPDSIEDSNTIDDQICNYINKNRIDGFLADKQRLQDLLIHYKKIKSRWTKADSSIKIIGMVLTGILTIGTTISGGFSIVLIGGTAITVLSTIFGGLSALNLFMSEGISIGLTSKKKKIYREICESIEHTINKLYLFQHKALNDGELSNEEIEESKKIISDVKKEIEKIKHKIPTYKDSAKDIKDKLKKEYLEKIKLIKVNK